MTITPRKIAVAGLCAVLAALAPAVISSPYLLNLFVLAIVFSILALSWNLINGYAGIFTFGHQAFFGIGAYVSALLAIHLGWSPWITLWIGAAAAAVAGILIGLPVLRIRSVAHVAIITLAFAEIVRIVVSNVPEITRGVLGLSGIPDFVAFTDEHGALLLHYYVALALLVLSLLIIGAVLKSRAGLALTAMRDSEDAAESLGVDLTRYKLLAFMVSSFIAGLGGAFYGHYLGVLTPESVIGISIMISILVMTLLGGIGTFFGPLLGAVLVTFGLEQLKVVGQYRLLLYGGILIVFIILLPRGLAHLRWKRGNDSCP